MFLLPGALSRECDLHKTAVGQKDADTKSHEKYQSPNQESVIVLSLTLLPKKYEVCRMDKDASIPGSILNKADFISVTRTAEELSIVCAENTVSDCVKAQRGMRAFKIEGPLSFDLKGILASLLNPLSEKSISVFAISTYDTDYLLVQEEDLLSAIDVLQGVCTIKEA
jgi:hypothetical protein